jgi:lipopolysaccharide transport system ATP-binding protein
MAGHILVEGVGKKYRYYHPDRPSKFKQVFTRGYRTLAAAGEFWALRNVSLTVSPGSMVGVIGHNGAGKSTLLRLVGGVGRPNEGRIATRGRIGALLDLGAGSQPELTGRDNVFLSGVIAGLTRRQVASRFDAIVAFAELEEFIDSPMRTYSSGMQLRLAFAVAVHTDPDVLLIDEVLSVGDAAFQKKCLKAIHDFKAGGCAILLISHEMEQIQEMCDVVYWLKEGHEVAHGAAERICAEYTETMTANSNQGAN